MNIATMRMIDRWAGMPVCAGLTLVDRLAARRRPAGPPRNVLIIQLSEMGSLALAYPSVREIQRRWPLARVHFLVFKRNRAFLSLLNVVAEEDIWTIDDASAGAFLRSCREFRRKARARRIDTALDYEIFSRASMILSWLSGASRRAGFYNYRAEGLYRGSLLTHPVFYNVYKHISLNFIAMARALAQERPEQPCLKEVIQADLTLPRRVTPPDRAQAMRARVRELFPALNDSTRIVVLSPFSGNLLPIRAWPPGHYVDFIRGLLERTTDTIALVIGLPEARDYCRPIFEAVNSPRLVDFIGRTRDIGEVVDLFNISHLLVTTDSGPPHFAAMTGLPAIVMFGPECPMLYGPLGANIECVFLGMSCSPCVSAFNHRNTPCDNNRCVQEISPAMILEMALSKLAR